MALTKEQVLTDLQSVHDEFLRQAEATGWLAPQNGGTWQVRDVAAHIAAWDRLLIADIGDVLKGSVPPWSAWDDALTDIVNDMQVRAYTSFSLEQLHAEVTVARQKLIATVRALDDEQFTKGVAAVDGAEYSPRSLCEYFVAHDRSHIEELSA